MFPERHIKVHFSVSGDEFPDTIEQQRRVEDAPVDKFRD